jgi:hypothetical protein
MPLFRLPCLDLLYSWLLVATRFMVEQLLVSIVVEDVIIVVIIPGVFKVKLNVSYFSSAFLIY